MRRLWINKDGSPHCILYFNGWGMDENVVKDISPGEYDVCMFNDYSSTKISYEEELNYDKIIVVAWSLGVCVANEILKNKEFTVTKSIAINGTPYPWHDKQGIPKDIFVKTLTSWNEQNRTKFNLRMAGGKTNLNAAAHLLSQRSIESQKKELQFFYDLGNGNIPSNSSWDQVFIGKNDRIIPAQNQLFYWKDKANIKQVEWDHFPFLHIRTWNEIIQMQ